MIGPRLKASLARFLADYGMLLVLLLLCVYYGLATIERKSPTGGAAAAQLARHIADRFDRQTAVLVATGEGQHEVELAERLTVRLAEAGFQVVGTVKGQPADARDALEAAARAGKRVDLIACSDASAKWGVFENLRQTLPALAEVRIIAPSPYRSSKFLEPGNLLNVSNQIVVIAILAVGMTMVILTGGIDLSVGSLVALSAVVAAMLIRDLAGGEAASPAGMALGCLGGVAACAAVGLLSGLMVALLKMPPFVVTLGMMLVARGLAYILAEGQSIDQVPGTFVWLGRGADLWGIPNAIVLLIALYAAAHVMMTRMPLGRYIYAVGGNTQAAQLSGVRVGRVLVMVYTMCGMLAGLGGIVLASQLRGGSPRYGEQFYELYTIAAVVVGGTSLVGGEGRILGTLIGAFIIAVIQNGMNLTEVQNDTQKIVLGLVILGAVLLDMLKRQGRLTRLVAVLRDLRRPSAPRGRR